MTTEPPLSSTDREVILQSLREPSAFGALFDRHAPVIHRVVSRRIFDRNAAEDVVAETFLRAFERRHRFHADRDSALPWLFGFALRITQEHARVNGRYVGREVDPVDPVDPLAASADRIDAQRQLAGVLDELNRMPAGSRDAVLLHVVGGLPYEDVAAALKVPVGTVRSRLNRARKKLREPGARAGEEGGAHGLDGTAACLS